MTPPEVGQPEKMEVSAIANVIKTKAKRKNTKVPLPQNALREVFLKNIFYLDRDYSKFIVVGYFEKFDESVGVLFKTGKSYAFWPYDIFNDLVVHFEEISDSLKAGKSGYSIKISKGYELKVRKVFGSLFVSIRDKERTVLLNQSEWGQLVRNLHEVKKHLAELFSNEQLIKLFIERVLIAESEDDAVPPDGLPTHFVNKLIDEVLFFKKWLVWQKQKQQ